MVSLIIGARGSQIRKFKENTGAFIEIRPPSDSQLERLIKISGQYIQYLFSYDLSELFLFSIYPLFIYLFFYSFHLFIALFALNIISCSCTRLGILFWFDCMIIIAHILRVDYN